MANVPLKYYINYLPDNLDAFHQMIKFTCCRKHPKLSVEESERIYEVLLVILDEYRVKLLKNGSFEQDRIEELYEGHKILFKIGFKPEIEEDLYELEIKNGNFDYRLGYCSIKYRQQWKILRSSSSIKASMSGSNGLLWRPMAALANAL